MKNRTKLSQFAVLLILCFCLTAGAKAQSPSLTAPEPEHRSPFLAALLSLAVPGLGEAYANRFEAGRYLVASEVGLWGAYAGLSVYTSDFQSDMESYAISNAGASSDKRGDQNYFAHVGQFQSSDIYNNEMLIEGTPTLTVSNGQGWSWASKSDQLHFDGLRSRVQILDNDRQFVLATIFVNHVISAIDAYLVARNYNRTQTLPQQEHSARFEVGGHMGNLIDPHGASLTARLTF